jgi:hypothetical protein
VFGKGHRGADYHLEYFLNAYDYLSEMLQSGFGTARRADTRGRPTTFIIIVSAILGLNRRVPYITTVV